jgi:hypothetical protein
VREGFCNELDVAMGVAEGVLPSPTTWFNCDYVAVRVSGVGVAWRQGAQTFVFRDPVEWLAPEMLRRALGLPVIVGHPPCGILNSMEFAARAVGTIVHSYIRNDELWGVARVIDAVACQMIVDGSFDTSPGVLVFPPEPPGATIAVDGDNLLVEASPALLDHLALVDTRDGNRGVWSRADGGNGPGVALESAEVVQ